jgi:hypothetical protein
MHDVSMTLAYMLTRSGGFKPKVEGPFVVSDLYHTAELRTTALVDVQASKLFTVHLDRVARATTVTLCPGSPAQASRHGARGRLRGPTKPLDLLRCL